MNTYTGNTSIDAGTLQIGGAGLLGSGNYAGTISNSAALVMNTSANQTFAGVISGSGGLNQLGSGVTTLTAADTYTGPTTVGAGTLAVANGGSLATASSEVRPPILRATR